MKYIILLISFCFFQITDCLSLDGLPFDLTRLTTDFNGVSNINNKIVIYGNNGIILFSKDSCKSWKQINLNDNSNITKVITYKSQFFGVMGNTIIKSDDGLNWLSFSNNEKDSLVSCEIINDELYILTKKSIFKYDIKLNYIEKLNLNFKQDEQVKEFIGFNNNLLVPISNNKILRFNIKSNIIDTLNFDNLNLTIKKLPKNIKIDNNEIYVTLNDNIYKSTDNGKNWILVAINSPNYEINNTLVYNIEDNNGTLFLNYSTFSFNQIVDSKKTLLNKDLINRYVKKYNIVNLKFINNNEIIAIGADKLILYSSNVGKNWEVVSHLEYKKAFDDFYLVDSLNIYWCAPKFQIFKTSDGGITWKPQYYTSDSINLFTQSGNNRQKFIFNNKGYGFCYVTSINQNGNNFDLNFMWTSNNGETYNFGVDKKLIYTNHPGTNVPYIVNSKNNKFLIINSYYPKNYYTLQYFLDDSLKYKNTVIYDSIQFLRILSDENQNLFGVCINRKYPKFNLPNEFDSICYTLLKSIDGGLNWNLQFKVNFPLGTDNNIFGQSNSVIFNNQLLFAQNYEKSTQIKYKPNGQIDTIIQGYSSDTLFKLNLINGEISKIHTSLSVYNNIFILNNRTYTCSSAYSIDQNTTNYFLYENKDPMSNLESWELINNELPISYKGKINNTSYFYINGNLFYANDRNQTSIETQTEDQTYFYSYPPYPIPAMNELKALIYWDMTYNIDDSDIGVYDIYGNKVADRDKLSINKLNSYSGYLTWDCSGASTGVYMIQIKHGTNTHNIRAMVVR